MEACYQCNVTQLPNSNSLHFPPCNTKGDLEYFVTLLNSISEWGPGALKKRPCNFSLFIIQRHRLYKLQVIEIAWRSVNTDNFNFGVIIPKNVTILKCNNRIFYGFLWVLPGFLLIECDVLTQGHHHNRDVESLPCGLGQP